MRIFITGGSGFVGTNLATILLNLGHEVVAVGRRKKIDSITHKNFYYISYDTTIPGKWQNELDRVDAVFNLAGAPIFKLWTKEYKTLIYNSRILTTRNIVDALPQDNKILLCSTSAAGYYGDRADTLLAENNSPGNDFLANVCIDWEKEAFKAVDKGTRVVTTRFGVILGKDGGAFPSMLPAFKFGVGGPLGTGKQWFPWIHLNDIISGLIFILDNIEINGPVNMTSPNCVRNSEFAKIFGKVLNRPAFIPAPAFMINLILGEFGQALLSSQRVMPEKLLKHGYGFSFPDLDKALSQIIKTLR